MFFTGSVIAVDIDPADTVGQVKQKISLKEGIPASQQQLIFSGMSLADDHMINTYNIQRDSTIHLVIKMSPDATAATGGKTHSGVQSHRVDAPPLNHSHSATAQLNNLDSGSSIDHRHHTMQPRNIPSLPSLPPAAVADPKRDDPFVINCLTQSGRQVRVSNVHSSDTVFALKERLSMLENVLLRQQDMRLYVGNTELEDRVPLSHYRILPDTQVRMELVTKNVCTLFIKTLNGKTFIIYPPETNTVSEIKAELADKSGIPATQQRLVYQGQDLPDQQTLTQCNVPIQCTLHVIQTNPPVPSGRPLPLPPLPLLVKTFTGKTITVFAQHGDSVRDIKETINAKEGYPLDEIVIMLGGNELEDDKVLDHYQIQQGSTLLVTFKPKEKMKLSVFDSTRSSIICLDDVNFTDSVSQIEHRLSLDVAVPRHAICLVFNGQVLSKHLSIQQCGIASSSIVYLYSTQPKNLQLTVKTIAGVECLVRLSSFQTVAVLKASVREILRVPIEEQVLLYKGNCLEDEVFVSDFISSSNSSVHLFTKRGVTRNVSLKITGEAREVKLRLPADTTIAQLKNIIEEDQHIPADLITVSYNGNELESPYTIGDYAVVEGAELTVNFHSRDVFKISVQPDNGGRAVSLQIDCTDSVRVLKHKIAVSLKIPVNGMSLSYCGVYLLDNCLVRECNLPSQCVLFAEIKSN